VCPITDDGRIDLDAAERLLTPEHTMVAFAHVSNVLGSVLDAKRAADLAHAVGAKLLLDGCQAVPRLPVDVAALGCDFYAFSATSSTAHRESERCGRGTTCSRRCRRGRAAGR
jgi:cysteine desulfurase/selenocysteine lyase